MSMGEETTKVYENSPEDCLVLRDLNGEKMGFGDPRRGTISPCQAVRVTIKCSRPGSIACTPVGSKRR